MWWCLTRRSGRPIGLGVLDHRVAFKWDGEWCEIKGRNGSLQWAVDAVHRWCIGQFVYLCIDGPEGRLHGVGRVNSRSIRRMLSQLSVT